MIRRRVSLWALDHHTVPVIILVGSCKECSRTELAATKKHTMAPALENGLAAM